MIENKAGCGRCDSPLRGRAKSTELNQFTQTEKGGVGAAVRNECLEVGLAGKAEEQHGGRAVWSVCGTPGAECRGLSERSQLARRVRLLPLV